MAKFAFIGAGSFGFTRTLVRNILTFDAFKDAEIALMDIDETRLEYITKAITKIIKAGNYGAKIGLQVERKRRLSPYKGSDERSKDL